MTHYVLKFGGSVLCDGEGYFAAVGSALPYVQEATTTIVVSASKGSTDALIRCAELSRTQLRNARQQWLDIQVRHHALARSLLQGELLQQCLQQLNRISGDGEAALHEYASGGDNNALAALLICAEKWSAQLLRYGLQAQSVDAAYVAAESLIRTSADALHGRVDLPATEQQFALADQHRSSGSVWVIPGFSGADASGNTCLLGRNASDYSAALVARCWGSELIIFGDTDGVYSTDPNAVAEACSVAELSIRDAEWLARAGAAVIHPRTFAALGEANVLVRLRGLDSRHGGTLFTASARRQQTLVSAFSCQPRSGELDKENIEHCAELTSFAAHHEHQDCSIVTVLLADSLGADEAAHHAHWLRQHVRAQHYDAAHHALWLLMADTHVPEALRYWQGRRARMQTQVAVAVIGASGRIGRRVTELLLKQSRNTHSHIQLQLVGCCNSTRYQFDAQGLQDSAPLAQALPVTQALQKLLGALKSAPQALKLVVDASASAEVAAQYPALLQAGIGIVTPNKIANAGTNIAFAQLQKIASENAIPYAYETTVGAALPVLKTIADLRRGGDVLQEVNAALSGTIGYVLTAIQNGKTFSTAIHEAVQSGYAEPDPVLDLCGEDVARKLLVLLRTAGIALNREDIQVQALHELSGLTSRDWSQHDKWWKVRVAQAHHNGKRLVYLAQYRDGLATVSLQEVSAESPFHSLSAVENAVQLRTDLYREIPLCIRGPGAGIEITAAGVFNDVLDACTQLLAHAQLQAHQPLYAHSSARPQRIAA